jgi:mono/diheme cytochrome c family protein
MLLFATQLNVPNLKVRAAGPWQANAQTQAAQSPQPSACKGVLSQPEKLKTSLPRVTKYQKTYVLLLAGSAKDKIKSPASPEIAELPIEINDEPESVAVAENLHLKNIRRVPVTSQSPAQPLADLASAKTGAAILWAPLAGAGLIDLELDDKVSVFSVDRPRDPPAEFARQGTGGADDCAAAINDELEGSGVLPAELLVPVNIRSLLGQSAPSFDLKDAATGGKVFAEACSKCHGENAVWDPALAPVDVLRSVPRFQYDGFKYIVMNGRPQKGMPPLRGTISEDQIASVYQYLRARSKKLLSAGPSKQ